MLLKAHYFIICLILGFLAFSCQGRKGEDTIYLIPKNFEGNLFVIFEQNTGKDTVYEGKRRVYVFDTSGVLKTKFKPNYGLQQSFFFYVDSKGNRISLKYSLPWQKRNADDVYAYNIETGNDFDTTKSVRRHFEMITIAKDKNFYDIGNKRSLKMWEVLLPCDDTTKNKASKQKIE
jgi:hypothetical protein